MLDVGVWNSMHQDRAIQWRAHMDGQSLVHYLKPIVVGSDPLERERLYAAMYRKARMTTLRAIGAVDVALWDLAGKIAGPYSAATCFSESLSIETLNSRLKAERLCIPDMRQAAVTPTLLQNAAPSSARDFG